MKERLLIIGASSHGIVALESALTADKYDVIGWIDSFKPEGSLIQGYKILGSLDKLQAIVDNYNVNSIFVAISNNITRSEVTSFVLENTSNMSLATIIHATAYISKSASVGIGSLVMPGAILNSNASVGMGCIINTNSSVDHDCVLGDFASVLPGVTVAGSVKIGCRTCICIGTSIAHGICIGNDSYIGGNSLVLSDIPSGSLAYGSPARVVRARFYNEKHF